MMNRVERMPKKIANFEIIQEIGHGGMGEVYLAKQMPVGRDVALKVLPVRSASDPEYAEAIKRFDSEAKAVSLLEHDNIVTLYDYGFTDNVNYLAMQYINGSSLFDLIQKYRPMPIDMIVEYAKQICRGLNYAHAKGVIHRDIKPQNILVSKDSNRCHITDFGIAKIKREERITIVGMAVGTPEYMSPEQAEGKNLDQQTDVYSLGILIYEMCTGNPPFYGNDPMSVAYRQVHEEPKKPSKLRHDIPVRLENIILKALRKNKNERYRGTHEILKDLDVLVSEGRDGISDRNSLNSAYQHPDKYAERRASERRQGDRRAVGVFDDESNRKNGFLRFVYKNIATIFIILLALIMVLLAAIFGLLAFRVI
ncbi:MAG: serine/threonine protein kinase [Chitinivibrionia bacterium]|nr:serine/threonine protein kinase [Chitinivibrionia bacterium]MCL1947414.1 serine/threonine protein kinase [Chitinivibrionia bacterium]